MIVRFVSNQIDLIDRYPEFNLAFVSFEQDFTVVYEEINQFRISPTIVFQAEIQRHFIMRDGDHWLHIQFKQSINQIIVVLQALFIRL